MNPTTLKCNGQITEQNYFKIEKFQWDEEKRSTFMEQIASPYVLNLIREATDLIDVDINESLLKFLEGLQKAGS